MHKDLCGIKQKLLHWVVLKSQVVFSGKFIYRHKQLKTIIYNIWYQT